MSRQSPPVLGFAAILALVLVGCGSASATPTVAPATAAATAAAATPAATLNEPSAPSNAPDTTSPTEAPSTVATAEPTASSTEAPTTAPTGRPSFVLPSFTTDKELEALLPSDYKGVKLTKFSLKGSDLLSGTDAFSKDILALLSSLGKSPNDLSFAFAGDPAGKLEVAFGDYRIKGVDASVWAPKLYDIAAKQSKSTATRINIGGKDVTKVVQTDSDVLTYAWPRGDVLFFINTKKEALAADAVAAMP